MIWRGKVSQSGNLPVMRYGGSSTMTVRRVIGTMKYRRTPKRREYAVLKCDNKLRVAWDHIVLKDVSEVRKRDGAKGVYSTFAVSVKRAMIARQRGKLTMEQIAEIRNHPGTQKEIAAIYGVDRSYIGRVKAGQKAKDYSNPFAGLFR